MNERIKELIKQATEALLTCEIHDDGEVRYKSFDNDKISRQLLIDIKAYIEVRVPGSTCSVRVIPGSDFIPPYIDAKIQFDDPKYETMYILRWGTVDYYREQLMRVAASINIKLFLTHKEIL